jgi:SAM-dependent methyltransferase
VARRLRELGVKVVTTDAAPGMQPDVVTRAEHLPFADASFDAVVSRVAHHHFDDPGAAMCEMARVSSGLVAVVDNIFMSDEAEEADRLRDPSHVRNYSETAWRTMFEAAGLSVEDVRHFDKPIEFQPWLDRVGCEGKDAHRVRRLLADRIEDGWVRLDRIAVRGRKD